MFGWVRCMKDQVVPTPPFVKPAAARLPVDGVFEGETATALQIFVGLDAKRGENRPAAVLPFCLWSRHNARVRLREHGHVDPFFPNDDPAHD